ncbi:MAG: hypothetical protein R3B84_22500 [Zavarzinella sp.]
MPLTLTVQADCKINTLQRVVDQAALDVQNNPALLRRLLTPEERQTTEKMRALNMGKAIERRVDELIAADPELHGVFPQRQVTYRDGAGEARGYIDWVDNQGAYYDATTLGLEQPHLDRPYGRRLGIAIWRGNGGESWTNSHWG